MAWQDSRKNMQKMLKTKDPKKITAYIWDCYKWPILGLLVLTLIAGFLIHDSISEKDHVLQGFFLNALTEEEAVTQLERRFLEVYPIEEEKEDIDFDASRYYIPELDKTSSYENLQLVSVRMIAGDVDFAVADWDLLTQMAYSDLLCDLESVLTPEQMETLSPYFLYYDKAIYRQMKEADDQTSADLSFPDPTKPEEMEEPVAIMVDLSASEELAILYPNAKSKYAFGFAINAENPENAQNLLSFLLNGRFAQNESA